MAEGMTGCRLGQAGFAHGVLHGSLQNLFVQVMPSFFPPARVD
jgi:hypothetical protein